VDVNLTAFINWLLHGNNGIAISGFIIAAVGACYQSPDVFGRKRLFLEKMTQCVITGLVGGSAFGIGVTIAGLPLAMLLQWSVYAKPLPTGNVLIFLQRLAVALPASTLLSDLKIVFINCFVLGVIFGGVIGIINGVFAVLFPAPTRRSTPATNAAQNRSSRDILIGWIIISIGFGLCLWFAFSNVLGLFVGSLLGLISFRLGFHPKPEEIPGSTSRQKRQRLIKMLGFWLIALSISATLLWHMFIILIVPQPILGTFLLAVVLIFYIYIYWQMGKLAGKKPTIRASKDQTGQSNITSRFQLVIKRPQLLRALLLGVICGFLIYGCAIGIPMAFFFNTIFGVGIAGIIWLIFSLLGLGYGAACGIVFIYCYNFEGFLSFKIGAASEKSLRFIGLIITIIGLMMAMLPSLSW